MSPPKPSIFSLWFAGLGGGIIGGSAVGVAEAGWVLTSTVPSEYQAIFYGAVIYGIIGGLIGAMIGVANVLAGWIGGLGPALGWCLGFFGTTTGLGVVIVRETLDERWYLEAGVPSTTTAGIVATLGGIALVGIWLGRNLLTKTPLRVVSGPKGTATLWGGAAGLAWIVSVAPAPGAEGVEVPHHPQDGTASRPNILLIHIDALRYDAVGMHAGEPSVSPNLDALAADGVVFDQAIAAASWTRASTASLFTSLSPSSHGCQTKSETLSLENITIAERLGEANYATGGFPNNANVTGALGFGQGFDWYPYAPEYPLGALESTYALSMYSVARLLYAKAVPEKHVEDYYLPAETQLERVRGWIGAQGADRWFAYVHLMEPHDPYFAHPLNGQAYGRAEHPSPDPAEVDRLRALYRGEVRHADEQLGRFFAQIRQEGLYDDALIVVTSDHGEEFQDHGGWWHGTTLYDEQLHVPLIVKLPKNDRAGTRVPWQVRGIDVPATIADVAGVPLPVYWDGEPLFSNDFDQQLAVTLPPPVDAEEPWAVWTPPAWWQLPSSRDALSEQDFEGYALQSFRSEGQKLLRVVRVPPGQALPPDALYDLRTDPGEQRPLLEPGESVRARLDEALAWAKAKAVTGALMAPSDAERARLNDLGYTPD